MLERTGLLVVSITNAFSEIWEGLAEVLRVSLCHVGAGDPSVSPNGWGAVIVAAGAASPRGSWCA